MYTKYIWLSVMSFFALNPAFGASEICSYELDPKSLQVQWTAFKTNQKVGVTGDFAEVALTGKLKDKDLGKLLQQLEAEIKVTDAEKIRTGNPARDTTLFQNFFGLWKGSVKGKIQNVKVNEKDPDQGSFNLRLTLNQKTVKVPFEYKIERGLLTATSTLDVLNFGLSKALASLHKACEALHTGADGVSKTWPHVDVKLTSKVGTVCE